MFEVPVLAECFLGGFTAVADTAIAALVPPAPPSRYSLAGSKRHFVRILSLAYNSGSTAHTLTILRPQGYTTLSAAAALNQAVINLTADPGAASTMLGPSGAATKIAANAIAAGDYVVVELTDGTYLVDTVASVATLAVTLTTGLPALIGAASGARVWTFGVTTDKDPFTGLAHPYFLPTASARTVYQDLLCGVCCSNNPYEPLVVTSDNATAAGTIEYIHAVYTDR